MIINGYANITWVRFFIFFWFCFENYLLIFPFFQRHLTDKADRLLAFLLSITCVSKSVCKCCMWWEVLLWLINEVDSWSGVRLHEYLPPSTYPTPQRGFLICGHAPLLCVKLQLYKVRSILAVLIISSVWVPCECFRVATVTLNVYFSKW